MCNFDLLVLRRNSFCVFLILHVFHFIVFELVCCCVFFCSFAAVSVLVSFADFASLLVSNDLPYPPAPTYPALPKTALSVFT